MQFRLALALSISVLLIGVASWYCFGTTSYVQPNIIAVGQLGVDGGDYEDILSDFTKPKTASSTSPQKPLTNTDIVGRQLILDYIGLAASGESGTESINNLANQYANRISILNTFEQLGTQDIIIVPDSVTNARNYAEKFANIYATHAERMSIAFNSGASSASFDSTNNLFAESASVIYGGMATDLKNVPVSNSLSQLHLELINTYLSNAAAMRSVHMSEEDPTRAFAGLVAIKENIDKELIILEKIRQILNDKWGKI